MSVVSGHLMAGALMGSSLNLSVQKIVEAADQNWMVILDAVLGGFSLSVKCHRDAHGPGGRHSAGVRP